MKINKTLKKCTSCAIAGLVNGIMGTGGGTVIYLTYDQSIDKQNELRCFMIAMVGIFSASGAVGSIGDVKNWGGYLIMAMGSIGGCLIGYKLMYNISGRWLKIIFSILLVVSGVKMLF